ncbi:hypothetical protein AB7360_17295 [Providencia alcalifaciens]|uniref:hypothetical protein n=1 Tax=Providencia alcalifaciens TaxID=126385 RepID=UPI0024AB0EF7|nr:hypothetical protein [Providencia rettgeri]ELR5228206.1 hypothetical protein [Providencia rettgeri]
MASLEERLFQFKVMRTFEIINFLIAIVSMSVWGRGFFIPSPQYLNYIPLLCAASTMVVFVCLGLGQYSKPDYLAGKVGFPSRKKMVLFIVKCLSVYVFFFSVGLAIKFS